MCTAAYTSVRVSVRVRARKKEKGSTRGRARESACALKGENIRARSLSLYLALALAVALSLSPSPTLSLSYRTRAPERAVCPPQVFLLDCRLLPFQAAQEAAERQTLDRAERERARERSQGHASRGGCTLHENVCVCVHFTRMCPRQQRCRFLA